MTAPLKPQNLFRRRVAALINSAGERAKNDPDGAFDLLVDALVDEAMALKANADAYGDYERCQRARRITRARRGLVQRSGIDTLIVGESIIVHTPYVQALRNIVSRYGIEDGKTFRVSAIGGAKPTVTRLS